MNAHNGRTNIDAITTCVRILEELEHEIAMAASAIAHNNLSALEESLWRQETSCARLKRSISATRTAMRTASSPIPLREAASRLRTQTQVYEKVVSHASKSTAILQHLCSLYRNATQHPGRTVHPAISREA